MTHWRRSSRSFCSLLESRAPVFQTKAAIESAKGPGFARHEGRYVASFSNNEESKRLRIFLVGTRMLLASLPCAIRSGYSASNLRYARVWRVSRFRLGGLVAKFPFSKFVGTLVLRPFK